MNFFSLLEHAVEKWSGDVAIVHRGETLRYSDLPPAAEFLAAEMRQFGLEKGDKIGILCPSGPEHIVATFAVLRLGGIVFYIPPASKADEVDNLAKEVGLDAFCYAAGFAARIPGREDGSCRISIISGKDPLMLKRLQRRTSQSERDRLLKINAAHISFSSGTTGKPKGIVVSHDTLLERVKLHREAPPHEKGDTILWLQPLGWLPGALADLVEGAKLIIGDAMDTRSLPGLIRKYRVTHVDTGPIFYRTILNERGIRPEDLRRVKYFLSGSMSLGKQIADAFADRYGHEIVEHYGSSECGRVFNNVGQDRSKRGSIGLPVKAEVKLISGDGYQLEGEAAGELLIRCAGMFDAYYRPWRLRDEVLEDGWFRTGDLARRDADGYYWIVGRTKEIIKVGGATVFPYEIEAVLLEHPAVEEAVVYGVAEGLFGEVPHAQVKLRAGETRTEREIMRYVNEKVSVFKSLRRVEFVNEIPKTVTGKPKRPISE